MFNVPEFSVSEFSNSIKRVVEDAFGYVRIRGEISGFKKAASGHVYFSLKDENSVLSAVCFKNAADGVDFEMADGLQIVASGQVTTYGGRSNYQIVVEKVEIAGIGAILAMIEKRRKKLAEEGLFDDVHKKEIPFFPKRIGVITSETGAVIQDILHRIEGRCPCHLMLYPVMVQGKNAAAQIVKAVKFFGRTKGENRPDVLIIARGGGSFEDLLAFQDEELVRAVFACEIPVISAVGHETDTTLIDYVADLRAPTPTAAAEFATPILADLRESLAYFSQRALRAKADILAKKSEKIAILTKYLINPAKILEKMVEKFKNLDERVEFLLKNAFLRKNKELSAILLSKRVIFDRIAADEKRILHALRLLKSNSENILKYCDVRLENISKLLLAKHYKEILNRGFCLIKDKNNKLISSISQVKMKEEISVEMKDGRFSSYVFDLKKRSVCVLSEVENKDDIQQKLI